MPCSHRLRAALGLAILAALIPGRAVAVPLYTITDLGSRGASAINNAGQVVGSGDGHRTLGGSPYLYQNGVFTDLSGKVGASAYISKITDAGLITGSGTTPTGSSYGFVLNPDGQLTKYPDLNVEAINNRGDTVIQPNSGTQATLNQNGSAIDLSGLRPSGESLVMTGLSDAGHVVGYTNSKGFLYQNGKVTDLGSLGGGGTMPVAVNAAGQVVGSSFAPVSGDPRVQQAFLYQAGKMTDLGTLSPYGGQSLATAINSLGQVVGTSNTESGIPNHAFLYQNGTMFDLNKLAPVGGGWILTGAFGINDRGQIISQGVNEDGRYPDYEYHAFLLTPTASTSDPAAVPEPGTVAFFALTAAGLAARRVWRGKS
jgi:probable HAF family extracellular repeat protein